MAVCLCLPACHKSVFYLLFRGCCSRWRFQPYDCAINLLGAHLDHPRGPLGGPVLLKWIEGRASFGRGFFRPLLNSGLRKISRVDWKWRTCGPNYKEEIARHEIAGQENRIAVFRCLFFKHTTLWCTLRKLVFMSNRQYDVEQYTQFIGDGTQLKNEPKNIKSQKNDTEVIYCHCEATVPLW